MKQKNIFVEHAADMYINRQPNKAQLFTALAIGFEQHGLEATRFVIGQSIDTAQKENDTAGLIFFHFALNEIHS